MLAFLLFVLLRAGPGVFKVWGELIGGRATTLLFTLGLVTAVQLFWRFTRLSWAPTIEPRVRRLVWTALPLSLLPWAFVTSIVLRSPVVREELMNAEPRVMLTAGSSLFMFTVGFGLPTFLGWLLFANLLREHGQVTLPHVKGALRASASTARDWAPMIFVLSGYEWMRGVVDAGFTHDRDALMIAIDQRLFFGTNPHLALEQFISRPLSESLAFGYSFYAVLYPLVLGTVMVTGGRTALRISSFRLGTALLIAYVSYCLIPVKGPVFTQPYTVPLDLFLVGPIKEALMDATRISYDCFPSMHTCCTVLLGISAWQWARRLFWVISPVVVMMPFACVYLRYHYVIDVLVGLALVLPMLWLSKRLERAIDPVQTAP